MERVLNRVVQVSKQETELLMLVHNVGEKLVLVPQQKKQLVIHTFVQLIVNGMIGQVGTNAQLLAVLELRKG